MLCREEELATLPSLVNSIYGCRPARCHRSSAKDHWELRTKPVTEEQKLQEWGFEPAYLKATPHPTLCQALLWTDRPFRNSLAKFSRTMAEEG